MYNDNNDVVGKLMKPFVACCVYFENANKLKYFKYE